MRRKDIQDCLVSLSAPLKEVMNCIDRNTRGIALVVDAETKLLGSVTDGDIRRGILSGFDLNTKVEELLARKSTSPYPEPITAHIDVERSTLLSIMQQNSVLQIPLVDDQKRVIDLVTLDELIPSPPPPTKAVVMAGGFGTRLRPLTDDLPKPMLPVGDRPLLERIIEQLRKSGVHNVNITTHYLPEKIKEHFGDGSQFGVELNYISESTPLGTAGALGLLDPPQEPMFVINGDILTQIDFRAMYNFHQEHDADATVAVCQYDYQVPYGVLECEGTYVTQLREKPKYSFFVNAGIYLLEPSVFERITPKEHLLMTELLEKLIATNGTVVSFPIVEYWLDIGQHADYQQALNDLQDGVLAL